MCIHSSETTLLLIIVERINTEAMMAALPYHQIKQFTAADQK